MQRDLKELEQRLARLSELIEAQMVAMALLQLRVGMPITQLRPLAKCGEKEQP